MNRAVFFALFLILSKLSSAQQLVVHGSGSDLYLTHNIAAKETWYSIGRTYNLAPKDVAAYNKSTLDKTLEVGQQLKVPLTSANFSQNDNKAADEVLVPVYHIVQDKEWMYRISVNHNKVPIERIEKWNSITRDEVKAGMKLIVGHLKLKKDNASLTTTSGTANEQGSATPAQTSGANTTTATPTQPVQPQPSTTTAGTGTSVPAQGGGGFFKPQFSSTGKAQSAVAGVFKSTSGWSDGKYYALINNVTVGTIIRITYPQSGKAIFAKVLGELPEMRESAGLGLRISDAAASELGAVSGKFSVDVAY